MLKRLFPLMLALCMVLAVPFSGAHAEDEPAYFGPFDAERLNGESGERVTDEFFKGAPITLLNYWATWCGPCVGELPDLAKLSELSEGKVQVLGVMLDSMDEKGMRHEPAIKDMETLAADAKITYPIVMPDAFLMEVAGMIVEYIPTTLIIDSEGNVLDMVVSANDAEAWLDIVDKAIKAAEAKK